MPGIRRRRLRYQMLVLISPRFCAVFGNRLYIVLVTGKNTLNPVTWILTRSLVNTIQRWGCLSGLLLLNVIFGIVKAGRKLSPRWGTLTRVGLFSLRKNLLPQRRRLLVLV